MLYFHRGRWCYRLWDINPVQGHKLFTLCRLAHWPAAKCHTHTSYLECSLSRAQNKPVMISAAHNLQLMHTITRLLHVSSLVFDRNIGGHLSINKSVDACIGTDSHVTSLEHVQARLTLSYNRRGNLAIHLISPAGTRSTLLHPRYKHTGAQTHSTSSEMQTVYAPSFHFPAGLTTTHQRVSMTGLSWPPTPGTRTPPGSGRWRLRTWLVPVTTVKHLCREHFGGFACMCVFISRIWCSLGPSVFWPYLK